MTTCAERGHHSAWQPTLRRVGPPWRRRDEYRCADCDTPVRVGSAELVVRDFHHLAVYNAEVARGLIHTPEWDERMAVAQAEFDRWSHGQP